MTIDTRPADRSGVPISIRNVSKVFGEDLEKPFRALASVDIEIPAGQFISIVGASGCGKSTLMLMVARPAQALLRRDPLRWEARRPPDHQCRHRLPDHLLLDFRTAFENVMLHADIRGLDRQTIADRARELFAQLRLEHAMNKYPRQLSGGMRQRVSLIRTLVHDPDVILMDEPFGALDALTRLQVRTDLEQLWLRRRPTVVFITHSVEEAVGLSDRIIVMSASRGKWSTTSPSTCRARAPSFSATHRNSPPTSIVSTTISNAWACSTA